MDASRVTAMVSDGNQKCRRFLSTAESKLRRKCTMKKQKQKTRPPGSRGKQLSKQKKTMKKKKPLRKTNSNDCSNSHTSDDVEIGRTGGIYLSMDATTRKGQGQCILELREMMDYENNELKEVSMRALINSHPKLKLWIHDLVCRANFADKLIAYRMLDKFHAKNHKTVKCRTIYNPRKIANKRVLKKFGVKNTQKAEQMWGRFFNRHYNAQFMNRLTFRAFMRHLCICFNASMRTQRRYRL
jgi:hypothetical protein